MKTAIIKNDLLRLPERIAKRLRGKRIEISEIKEGILLKEVGNPIAEARGFLKGNAIYDQKVPGNENDRKGFRIVSGKFIIKPKKSQN
jgi:hypothetical protein